MNNKYNHGKIDWKKCKEAVAIWERYKNDIKALERIVKRK